MHGRVFPFLSSITRDIIYALLASVITSSIHVSGKTKNKVQSIKGHFKNEK